MEIIGNRRKISLFSFSTTQTEKNWWKKIVKQICEKIWWIRYLKFPDLYEPESNWDSIHHKDIPCISKACRIWAVLYHSYLVTNSSDNFTNLFHDFFPPIFLSLSSWKRKQTSYWFKTGVFSQFDSWKRNHNKYSLKKFVDAEFKIGKTIWWIR